MFGLSTLIVLVIVLLAGAALFLALAVRQHQRELDRIDQGDRPPRRHRR